MATLGRHKRTEKEKDGGRREGGEHRLNEAVNGRGEAKGDDQEEYQ